MDLKTAPVGTILYASWGFEQTNYDFYQIIERRGLSTMVLRKLKTDSEPEGWCRNKVTPCKDQFTDAAPITRRVNMRGYAKIEPYAHLYVWDGAPKHATSYA